MKLLLFAFLLILSFNILAQSTNSDCKPDSARIAMLQFTNYRVSIFDSTYNSSALDKREYCLFQKILIAFFNEMTSSAFRLSYKDHRVQYIPVVDTNGKKLVLINVFCKNYGGYNGSSWRNEIVRPSDGGPCYFLGVVDLVEKKVKDLWFNGEARIKKPNRIVVVQVSDTTEVK